MSPEVIDKNSPPTPCVDANLGACINEQFRTCRQGGRLAYDPTLIQQVSALLDIVEERRQTYHGREDKAWCGREAFMAKALELSAEGKELVFSFPGFPCKSPNCDTKVLGTAPDMAEKMSIANLREMMEEMNEVFPNGARLMIVSDGLPFNGIFHVSDEVVHSYVNELRGLAYDSNIEFLSMIELIPEGDTIEEKRRVLREEYAPSEEALDHRIRNVPEVNAYYTGLKRFLQGDMLPYWLAESETGKVSRDKQNRLVKPIAREFMLMNEAFNALVAERVPNVMRLSCHPQYEDNPDKVGIELIFGKQRYSWATPWHNAMVKLPDGSWDITRKEVGLKRGCSIVYDKKERPSHLLAAA